MTFGIAEFDSETTSTECINRADLALYLGKRNGKNRVELYQGV
jgi:PleD family two-component response regulator